MPKLLCKLGFHKWRDNGNLLHNPWYCTRCKKSKIELSKLKQINKLCK